MDNDVSFGHHGAAVGYKLLLLFEGELRNIVDKIFHLDVVYHHVVVNSIPTDTMGKGTACQSCLDLFVCNHQQEDRIDIVGSTSHERITRYFLNKDLVLSLLGTITYNRQSSVKQLNIKGHFVR